MLSFLLPSVPAFFSVIKPLIVYISVLQKCFYLRLTPVKHPLYYCFLSDSIHKCFPALETVERHTSSAIWYQICDLHWKTSDLKYRNVSDFCYCEHDNCEEDLEVISTTLKIFSCAYGKLQFKKSVNTMGKVCGYKCYY